MAEIFSFSPTSATQGQTVTITGMFFTGAAAVFFGAAPDDTGGTPAASFVVVNDTTVRAVVGTGSSGFVTVWGITGVGGQSGFTYLSPPNPSTPSGKVSQNNLSGSQYLYTDTGTYGAVTSRILSVYDSNGNIVGSPYNMGANLTQIVPIAADGTYTLTCVVVDNAGTWTTSVIYVCDGYYVAAFLALLASLGCDCIDFSMFENLIKGEIYFAGSQRYAISALLPASQAAITAANTWINNTF